MRTIAGLVMGMAAVACGPGATLTMTDVGTPVTLGPVQRVGGGRGGHERLVATVEGEAGDFVAVSQTKKDVGHGIVEVKQTTTVASTKADEVSAKVQALVESRADRDTRIDDVSTGAWAYITTGAAGQHRWVGMKGHVVEVSRGN